MYSVGNIVSNYVISNIFAWRYILTYFADQFEMYTNIKSLCCITRINIMMSVSWLVFREYAFSMSALWCPLETCIILLGFLLPWAWGISSRLLQQSTAAAPYLGREVSPHCRPSWPSAWDGSSRPPAPAQPLLLGHGVAPPGRHPWPRAWGCSSRPPPLTSDTGWLLVTTKGERERGRTRRGVELRGRVCCM